MKAHSYVLVLVSTFLSCANSRATFPHIGMEHKEIGDVLEVEGVLVAMKKGMVGLSKYVLRCHDGGIVLVKRNHRIDGLRLAARIRVKGEIKWLGAESPAVEPPQLQAHPGGYIDVQFLGGLRCLDIQECEVIASPKPRVQTDAASRSDGREEWGR